MHILNRGLRYAGFFYEIISSSLCTDDEGLIDTKNHHGLKERFIQEKSLVGDMIALRAVIKGAKFAPNSSRVTLILEGEPFKSRTLYDDQTVLESSYPPKDCQYESLQILYNGHGYLLKEGEKLPFRDDGVSNCKLSVAKNDVLLNHRFDYTNTNLEQRISTFASGLKLTSPPGCVNAHVFMPYGGHIPDTGDLEEIKQIYFTLTATQGETRLILENDPINRTLHMKKTVIHPASKTDNQCAPQRIVEGDIKMTVERDGLEQSFQSFSYQRLPLDEEIEIYFHPINREEDSK